MEQKCKNCQCVIDGKPDLLYKVDKKRKFCFVLTRVCGRCFRYLRGTGQYKTKAEL